MNTWESLWPDGQIGWPRHADPAAVLLHLTPALLLIGLTETIAAYRRTVTDLIDRIDSTELLPPTTGTPGSVQEPMEAVTDHPDPTGHSPQEGGTDPDSAPATTTTTGPGHGRPHVGDHTPPSRPTAPAPAQAADGATDADMWPRAVALDNATRASTGKPVSIWRLRTELRIGPQRARQIRDQLLSRHTNRPPVGEMNSADLPADPSALRYRSDPLPNLR